MVLCNLGHSLLRYAEKQSGVQPGSLQQGFCSLAVKGSAILEEKEQERGRESGK